uniref:Uncharacterized protein n=1 Tax=Oncorhynchus kisutch TaxID=8019 RepID=A0A8C7HIH6_ONCKI
MFSHQFIHILVEVVCVQFRDINCCNSGHNLADVAQYYMFSFIPYYHYILPSLPTSGCCAALGSMWSCPLACHGRPNMTSPSVTTLTLKTAATIVGTGATMPTTATVSAGGVEVVGADRGLVPDPGHVAAVIDPVPAAMTAACTAPHLIPNIGRGPAPLCGPSPGHLLGGKPLVYYSCTIISSCLWIPSEVGVPVFLLPCFFCSRSRSGSRARGPSVSRSLSRSRSPSHKRNRLAFCLVNPYLHSCSCTV